MRPYDFYGKCSRCLEDRVGFLCVECVVKDTFLKLGMTYATMTDPSARSLFMEGVVLIPERLLFKKLMPNIDFLEKEKYFFTHVDNFNMLIITSEYYKVLPSNIKQRAIANKATIVMICAGVKNERDG